MMTPRVYCCLEKTTPIISATIVDDTGTPLPAASLNTLTLTLYDLRTAGVINSRSAQNVLNQNQVTVNSAGLLTWQMVAGDNPIVNTALTVEVHRALLQFTYGSAGSGKHELDIEVTNVGTVT